MIRGNPLPPEVNSELQRQLDALLKEVKSYTDQSIAIIKQAQQPPAHTPYVDNYGTRNHSMTGTTNTIATVREDISTYCKRIEEQIGVITKKLNNLTTPTPTNPQVSGDTTGQSQAVNQNLIVQPTPPINAENQALAEQSAAHGPKSGGRAAPLHQNQNQANLRVDRNGNSGTHIPTPLPEGNVPPKSKESNQPNVTTVLDDIHWIVLIAIAIIFAIAGWWQVIYGTSAQPTPMERLTAIATDSTLAGKAEPILKRIEGNNPIAKTLQNTIQSNQPLSTDHRDKLIEVLFQHFIDRWRTADTDQKISTLLGCPDEDATDQSPPVAINEVSGVERLEGSKPKSKLECQAKMVVYALENWSDIETSGASSQVSNEVVTYTDPKSAWDALIKPVADSGSEQAKLKRWLDAIVDGTRLCPGQISEQQKTNFKNFRDGQTSPITTLDAAKGVFEYIAILTCRGMKEKVCGNSKMTIDLKLNDIPETILKALDEALQKSKPKLPESFSKHGAVLTKQGRNLTEAFIQAVVAYNVLMLNSSLITTATQPTCN